MVSDINGGSSDLMAGHGGKCVGSQFVSITLPAGSKLSQKNRYSYLSIDKGRDFQQALTNITLDIRGSSRDGGYDMAQGCGGKYVYVDEHRDTNNRNKIVRVALVRSGDSKNDDYFRQRGFNGWTGDVAAGRGGDYVYIVWETVSM